MSNNQFIQDRINQYSQKHDVDSLINNLVSKDDPKQLSQQKSTENSDTTSPKVVGLFYCGFITIGIATGALTGYFASGGRRKFISSGGWIDTLFGMSAGLMIGIGLGKISDAILRLRKG